MMANFSEYTSSQAPGASHPAPARTITDVEDDFLAAHQKGDRAAAKMHLKELKRLRAEGGSDKYALPGSQEAKEQGRIEKDRAFKSLQKENVAGMSRFDRAAAGLGHSATNTARAIGQLFGVVSKDDVAESRRMDAALMDDPTAYGASLAGDVGTSMLPGAAITRAGRGAQALGATRAGQRMQAVGGAAALPRTMGQAAAGGAAQGGLLVPTADDAEVWKNLLAGGIGGGFGHAALGIPSRVLSPNTSQDALTLIRDGVNLTPGQTLGGIPQRLENAFSGVFGIGDVIQASRERAQGELRRAAGNRALAPIGQQTAETRGNEIAQDVSGALGRAYEGLLQGRSTEATPELFRAIDAARARLVAQGAPPAAVQRFDSLVQNQVLGRFEPGPNAAPTMTADVMKGADSNLADYSSRLGASSDFDLQNLGQGLSSVRQAMRDAFGDTNPGARETLGNIDAGWANYARLRDAAKRSDSGDWTPQNLATAVRQTDRSVGKGSVAQGRALMQDLSSAASNVMRGGDQGNRWLSTAATGAAGAGLSAASGVNPLLLLAGLAGAAPLYTDTGKRIMNTLLARRTQGMRTAGDVLGRLAGGSGQLGARTMLAGNQEE